MLIEETAGIIKNIYSLKRYNVIDKSCKNAKVFINNSDKYIRFNK